MDIQMREYIDRDFTVLRDVIKETWKYERFCDPKTAQKLACVFLSSCLTNYTFSRVALCDGKPVGIILGKIQKQHHCSFRQRIRQLQALLSLYISKEGRKAASIFESVNGIDKHLLKETGKRYPAELALFAIDPSYRGLGIGKCLFAEVKRNMVEHGVREFYLYTDTSCNYGFYEHQGMIRRCEKAKVFEINEQREHMNFFIYDFQL